MQYKNQKMNLSTNNSNITEDYAIKVNSKRKSFTKVIKRL